MVKLLILADDFTGALDTGVQFSGKGIRTQVVVSSHWVEPDSDCDVMVIDVETRHVPKEKAYEIVVENTNKIMNLCEEISPVRPDKCPPVIENSDEMLRKRIQP